MPYHKTDISVLIIAHNEERHIQKCIESLLAQSKKPDEIVLIAHNSNDDTAEIARGYPVRVVEYAGPAGSVYARIKGFEEVTGDIVLCIDGDAHAAKNWVEVLTALLAKPGMAMVGSWIKMSGAIYSYLGGYCWYFFCNSRGFNATDWMWGASFGLWVRDREHIISALKEGAALSEKLKLPSNPDDYWLALFMSKYGNLEVTNKTWVDAYAKETSVIQWLARSFSANFLVRKPIRAFIERGGIPGVQVP